jgi:hypothetical protein
VVRNEKKWILPYYAEQPERHQLGDRVIYIGDSQKNGVSHGEVGIIGATYPSQSSLLSDTLDLVRVAAAQGDQKLGKVVKKRVEAHKVFNLTRWDNVLSEWQKEKGGINYEGWNGRFVDETNYAL